MSLMKYDMLSLTLHGLALLAYNTAAMEMTSKSNLGMLARAVLLLAGAWPLAAQQSSCPQPQIAASANQVESARNALLELPIGNGAETDVSPRGQEAIATMKDRLADFIDAYMRCAPPRPDAAKVKADLSALAHAYQLPQGVTRNSDLPEDFGKYGFELWFDAKAVPEDRLLSVTATFYIECGGDTVLLIYAPKGGSWEQVLRWQGRPYMEVSGAFWAFDYGISPPDESGDWYAVTKSISPWCSSTWSSIHYAVLRPGAVPPKPAVLLAASDSIWWGNDDTGKLVVNRADFDLRFHAESIDPAVHNRTWIRHFAVSGNVVRRVRPVAMSVGDFVDEWIVSPWSEASAWSAAGSAGLLKESHERLAALQHSTTGDFFSFDAIRQCSDSPNHWQVELSYGNPEQQEFFFHVIGRPDYVLSRIADKADPHCNGPNELYQSGE